MSNEIKKVVTKDAIIATRVYSAPFQKEGTLTCELKQTIHTKSIYPSAKVTNSLQDNMFEASEFGFKETEHDNTEVRVAWILVPMGTTVDIVTKKLTGEACIYKVLAYSPIVTEEQDFAIKSEDIDYNLDDVANRQVCRYGVESGQEGALILHKDEVQYKCNFFSMKPKSDMDYRKKNSIYRSREIDLEYQPELMLESTAPIQEGDL